MEVQKLEGGLVASYSSAYSYDLCIYYFSSPIGKTIENGEKINFFTPHSYN